MGVASLCFLPLSSPPPPRCCRASRLSASLVKGRAAGRGGSGGGGGGLGEGGVFIIPGGFDSSRDCLHPAPRTLACRLADRGAMGGRGDRTGEERRDGGSLLLRGVAWRVVIRLRCYFGRLERGAGEQEERGQLGAFFVAMD